MRTVFLIGALLAALAGHAHATEVPLLKYLDWITANSEFEYNGEPLPRVVETSAETLKNMTGAVDPAAVYSDRTIYLLEGLPEDERTHTLVHELVHYLQDLRGDYTGEHCVGDLEPAAYEIEEAWMDAHGHAGARPDWFTIYVNRMHCKNPH